MPKKLLYGIIMLVSMVGVAPAKASVHDYPPPQYVCDKLVNAYWRPVDKWVDPGYMNKLTVSCYTRDRIHYSIVMHVREPHDRFDMDFTGHVYKGRKATRIDRWLGGRVRLNSSRYITMNWDDLIGF